MEAVSAEAAEEAGKCENARNAGEALRETDRATTVALHQKR